MNKKPGKQLEELIKMMEQLRGPKGCLWDKEQTMQSFVKYLEEEAEEVVHAVESDDMEEVCEELGDLLWNVVVMCQIAQEQGLFGVTDAMESIRTKIIRRHPHVFGKVKVKNVQDIIKLYKRIKKREKKDKQKRKKVRNWGE